MQIAKMMAWTSETFEMIYEYDDFMSSTNALIKSPLIGSKYAFNFDMAWKFGNFLFHNSKLIRNCGTFLLHFFIIEVFFVVNGVVL